MAPANHKADDAFNWGINCVALLLYQLCMSQFTICCPLVMVNVPVSSMAQQQQWLQHTEEKFQVQRLKLVQWQSVAIQQLKQHHAEQIDQLKMKQKQVGSFTQDDCRQQIRRLHYHKELARQQQLQTHKAQLKELKRQQQEYLMQMQLQQLEYERTRLIK